MNWRQAQRLAKLPPEWLDKDAELQKVANDINLPFYVKLAKDNEYLFEWFVNLLYLNGFEIIEKEKKHVKTRVTRKS